MQNRYAGDLGDFLKLALLRWLVASNTAERTLRLGVVWYLVPDEDHNADGKHINYLDPTRPAARRFRTLDPDLYDALTSMMRSEASRSVAGLERCGALPPETVTFGTPLTFGSLAVTDRAQRLERRQRWAPLRALEYAKGERGEAIERVLRALATGNRAALAEVKDRGELEALAEVLQKMALDGAFASLTGRSRYGGAAVAGNARAWLAYARTMGRNRVLTRHPLNPKLFAADMVAGMPKT